MLPPPLSAGPSRPGRPAIPDAAASPRHAAAETVALTRIPRTTKRPRGMPHSRQTDASRPRHACRGRRGTQVARSHRASCRAVGYGETARPRTSAPAAISAIDRHRRLARTTHVGSAGLRPSPSPRHGGVRSYALRLPLAIAVGAYGCAPGGGLGGEGPITPAFTRADRYGQVRADTNAECVGERGVDGPLEQRPPIDSHQENETERTERTNAALWSEVPVSRPWSRVNADMGAPPSESGEGLPQIKRSITCAAAIRKARTRRAYAPNVATNVHAPLVPQV